MVNVMLHMSKNKKYVRFVFVGQYLVKTVDSMITRYVQRLRKTSLIKYPWGTTINYSS